MYAEKRQEVGFDSFKSNPAKEIPSILQGIILRFKENKKEYLGLIFQELWLEQHLNEMNVVGSMRRSRSSGSDTLRKNTSFRE